LGETTTFPLIVFSMINLKDYNQASFFLEIPKLNSQVESLENFKIEILMTLKAYNFLFKPLIEVRLEAKS